MAFIELDGISRSFVARDGSTTLAVDGVDLTVGNAEFVSLLGPSGCGKSTLLSIIAGLMEPSSGCVSIEGRPIRAPGKVPTPEGTLIKPGNQGGTNWYSPSFSPRTGLFYIPTWANYDSIYVKQAVTYEEGTHPLFINDTVLASS